MKDNKFQTKSSLVWEKMLTIVDNKNPKPILVWFEKTVSPNDNNFDIMQPAKTGITWKQSERFGWAQRLNGANAKG